MSLSETISDINNLTLAQRRAIAEEFLMELAAGCEDDERVIVCQKDEVEGGFPMRAFQPDSTTLRADANVYACIATVNKSEHKDTKKPVWSRKIEHFRGGHALMLDDVGTGKGSKGLMTVDALAAILPPTAVIETSPQNFQVLYFFDHPCRDPKLFKNFIVSFVEQVMVTGGDKLDDPVRVFRAPFGVNAKRAADGTLKYADENGNPWIVRLHDADYDRRYSIEQICAKFNVKISESAKYEKRSTKHERNAVDDAILRAAVEAFEAAGAIKEDRTDAGKYRIRCPWGAEHSSGDWLDAFIAGPDAGLDHAYVFSCSHTTCKEAKRGWSAFVRELELDETIGEKIVAIAAVELDRAAANDAWFRAFQWGDEVREETVEQPRQTSVEETQPISPADAMKKGRDDRSRLEAKQSTDLGVGLGNWMEGWWYSMGEGKACRPGNHLLYGKQDFNAVFGYRFASMDGDERKGLKGAWDFVQFKRGFKTCAATAYVMGRHAVFEWDNRVYVNLFDERTVPATADEYTWEGIAATQTIEYHLKSLFGSQASADRVASWIAMNVQRPGELIGFAPLVKGIEGDGKTIIFQGLMGALLGDANVGQVSGDQITENTGWAKGRAVVAIEEIKPASGENRYHITNKMKPFITNAKIDVVDKFVKRHETINATNYVGMTNFANALPLKDGDRRWMVEFTQWKSIEEFIAVDGVAGVPKDKALVPYFERILWAIREQAPQLRKYFKEYRLKAGMAWGMRAPETDAKRLMVGIENSDSGLDKIKAYFDEGALGVSKDIVSTSMLNDHIARDTGEKRLMTRQIAMMLLDLGFAKVPWDLKWEGKAHTIYVRDSRVFAVGPDEQGTSMANGRLRKLLDATKTDENKKEYVPRVADGNKF